MSNDEFQELKEYHLNKPAWKIRSPRKGGPGRLSDLYHEVKDINWKRKNEPRPKKLTNEEVINGYE